MPKRAILAYFGTGYSLFMAGVAAGSGGMRMNHCCTRALGHENTQFPARSRYSAFFHWNKADKNEAAAQSEMTDSQRDRGHNRKKRPTHPEEGFPLPDSSGTLWGLCPFPTKMVPAWEF